MKITQSPKNISPFGGFNFCHEFLGKTGLPALIDKHLGKRVETVGFDYSDIFTNHLAIFLHGGDCTEDVNEHLRSILGKVKGMAVCSADTILRGIKELATPTNHFFGPSGIAHEFNINIKLNQLLVKALLKTKQLGTVKANTVDYDNQVVPTEKYDAKKTYKKCNGYQSGVASIGKHIVYIEGRNGNSPAKYEQKETLQRAFSILDEEGVKADRFRADCASYQKEVIDMVSNREMLFYIRAASCGNMDRQIGALPKEAWGKVRLGTQEMEIAEIDGYQPFGEKKAYRLVVSRIKRKDKQTDVFSGTAYTYRAIITNDRTWDKKQVTSFYNQRGSYEKAFDVMNNDFGWANLPCSFLNENTSFMIMTAIYYNFYLCLISAFAKKLPWLQANFRLKKFIFRFITVAAQWVKTGRQYVLKLYTTKDYSPLAT